MNINIITPTGREITPGKYLTDDMLIGKNLPARCTLVPATYTDIDGREVIITGQSYIINSRTYDLGISNYGLKALLTKNNRVIPMLRKAIGSERGLIRDRDRQPINVVWPILVRLWEKEPKPEPQPILEYENSLDLDLLDESLYQEPEED